MIELKNSIESQIRKDERKKCIEEFIKDLEYLETITIPSNSPSNVFLRIQEIKEKWEKEDDF